MTFEKEDIKSIAIFRALQLGDLLCSVPAFRAIREAYSEAKITLISLPGSRIIYERFHTLFDNFVAFPGYHGLPEQTFTMQALKKFEAQMQLLDFDLVLQMQGNGSIVNDMINNWGAKQVAGFCPFPCQQNEYFLTYPNYGHESLRHLALLEHLQIPVKDPAMSFPITPADRKAFARLNLPLTRGQYICVHTTSRGAWRQWPTAHFAALSNYCQQQGFQVVLTGVSDELPIVTEVAALIHETPIIVAGKTDLGQLAVLLDESFMLISNCTGVSHIAAAIKKRSLIISMDGEPERWAPIDKNLHPTIDWTITPDYELVLSALRAILESSNSLTAPTTSSGDGSGTLFK
jgi:ADP-heptose:LPS heptosyltransferase